MDISYILIKSVLLYDISMGISIMQGLLIQMNHNFNLDESYNKCNYIAFIHIKAILQNAANLVINLNFFYLQFIYNTTQSLTTLGKHSM